MIKDYNEKKCYYDEVISLLMSFAYVIDHCRSERGGKSFINIINNHMIIWNSLINNIFIKNLLYNHNR